MDYSFSLDISSHLLTEYKTPTNVECIFVEISMTKNSWLLCCSYNPHKSNISTHMHHLSKSLDIYINITNRSLEILILKRRKTIWMIFAMFIICNKQNRKTEIIMRS